MKKEYYEKNLPPYLQLSLDTFKAGEQDEHCTMMDCYFSDLQASINCAEIEDLITPEHANYLRTECLGIIVQ